MKISEDAQAVVKKAMSQVAEIKTGLQNYLNGLKSGLGLKGSYTFDEKTMEFKEKKDDKPSKKRK